MSKITGIIIAKNEEEMIGDALDSISFCDEIIVVDNNSEDKTKEIAEKKNAKVIGISSTDFSEIRNLGFEKASNEWVLYLDADERVDQDLRISIGKVVSEGSKYSAFKLFRKNFYFGKTQWPFIEKLERLFKKDKLLKWQGKLHESPVVEGEVGELPGYIVHYTHRDLSSMMDKTIEWSTAESLLRYNTGHPKMTWWRFPRVMFTAFFNSYIRQKGFKAGTPGLVESIYQAFSMFITYAKLWELQNKLKDNKQRAKNREQ